MAKAKPRSNGKQLPHSNFFGEPPLLEGEDCAAYNALLKRVDDAVKPRDIFEEAWVRKFVDLTWESFRNRRFKTQLMTANIYRGMKAVLEPLCGYREAEDLSCGWAVRDEEDVEKINEILSNAGLTMDEAMAETFAIKIKDFERIESLIANAEVRAQILLREIDRHRIGLGHAIREAKADIGDIKYKELKPPQTQSGMSHE